MKKEIALEKIKNAVQKRCPNECLGVKKYIEGVIYLFFKSLELDPHEDSTSTENLKFAIEVNLSDLFYELLSEARKDWKNEDIYLYE